MTLIQFFSMAAIVIAAFFVLSVAWGISAYIRDTTYDKIMEFFDDKPKGN